MQGKKGEAMEGATPKFYQSIETLQSPCFICVASVFMWMKPLKQRAIPMD